MPDVWDADAPRPRGRVGGRRTFASAWTTAPPRTRHARAGHGGARRCSCSCCCGSRGCGWSTSPRCRSRESIVEYYLGLLPGVIPRHARARLTLVSVGDGSPRPLSAKLLERPRLLRRSRELIPNRARCHLIAYNTTALERDVALSLGIPMYGARPAAGRPGQQDRLPAPVRGGRRPLPDRRRGPAHRRRRSSARSSRCARDARAWPRSIVKLNDGVSGQGNAVVDLRGLPGARRPGRARTRSRERVGDLQLESARR